jgi:Zn finger protein HypA/HybF involved in hydrogenase expression
VHEVGLVAELVDAALERSRGRPVALVRVRRATTVPEDVLAQAFEMLVPGTLLDGATLEVEPFDIRLACPCGFDGALAHDDVIGSSQAVCPGCGGLRGIPPMAELELLEVVARPGS